MIKIEQKQAVEKINFVIAARSKDKIIPIFAYIYVDDENVVCTDSRRLHILKKEDFTCFFEKNGFYEVIKATKKEIILNYAGDVNEIGVFPNYNQVLWEKEDASKSIEITFSEASAGAIAFYRIMHDLEFCLNPDFIYDAIGWTDAEWTVRRKESYMSSVIFESGVMTAVIMPILVKNEGE